MPQNPTADPFVPKPKMLRYVRAFLELGDEGAKLSVKQVSEKAGIERETVANWNRNPAYRAWFEAAVLSQCPASKGSILFRFAVLARQGSVEHFKELAKVFGWYAQLDPEQAGASGCTVLVAPPGSDEAAVKAANPKIIVRV
jgi:hypothetical protein